MKKLLAIAAGLAAVAAVRRNKGKESSDVWRNATRAD
jgi:hypothetical protein